MNENLFVNLFVFQKTRSKCWPGFCCVGAPPCAADGWFWDCLWWWPPWLRRGGASNSNIFLLWCDSILSKLTWLGNGSSQKKAWSNASNALIRRSGFRLRSLSRRSRAFTSCTNWRSRSLTRLFWPFCSSNFEKRSSLSTPGQTSGDIEPHSCVISAICLVSVSPYITVTPM